MSLVNVVYVCVFSQLNVPVDKKITINESTITIIFALLTIIQQNGCMYAPLKLFCDTHNILTKHFDLFINVIQNLQN